MLILSDNPGCRSPAGAVFELNTIQQALNLLITTRKTPLTEYTLLCDYAQLSGIEALLKQFNGVIAHSDYQAMVQLRVALPQAELAAFSAKLADFSRGSLQLLPIEE